MRRGLRGAVALALGLSGCTGSDTTTEQTIVMPPPPPDSVSALQELVVAGAPIEVLVRAGVVRACALLGLGDVDGAKEELAIGTLPGETASDVQALLDSIEQGVPPDEIVANAPCPTE